MALLQERVAAPPAVPPLISLLSSAVVIEPPDAHWGQGITYQPEGCVSEQIDVLDVCSSDAKSTPIRPTTVRFTGFVVEAAEQCTSLGSTGRDWKGRALRLLAACESKAIERELWRGTTARSKSWTGQRWLADPASDNITEGGAVAALDALAFMEQYLAQTLCGSRGMIHASPQIVTYWLSEYAARPVVEDGKNRIITGLGTIIVPGAGYDGSRPPAVAGDAPVTATAGNQAIYGTGMLEVRLDTPQVFPSTLEQATDRSVNTITFRAERVAAYSWNTCAHGFALVNVPLPTIGGSD